MPSQGFDYTGHWQQWPVPNNVKTIRVTVNGAGANAQHGGQVVGQLDLKDSDVLWIAVGGTGKVHNGHHGGEGGWPSGGNGGDGVNANGGDGGAGATFIRLNGSDGRLLCVAAGAGGDSGDNGDGGAGGADSGESGHRGSAGNNATGQATGGTQTQPGNKGVSSSGGQFDGHDAGTGALGHGGNGGDTGGFDGPGGGGGGQGYRSGGGGQGGSDGWAPGGGGAGGSNFVGSLSHSSTTRGGGNSGNGHVLVEWDVEAPANQRPSAPSLKNPDRGERLGDTSVTIKAELNDPDSTDANPVSVGMIVTLGKGSSLDNARTYSISDFVTAGKVASLRITGLAKATHYYAHIYAQDRAGNRSLNYTTADFYTNFPPDPPTLHLPSNGREMTGLGSTVFTWSHHDPDGGSQRAAQIRWRKTGGDWVTHDVINSQESYTANPGTFKSNTFYTWQVRTRDHFGDWGEWSDSFRFYISGSTRPPAQTSPIKDEAVASDQPVTLNWKFFDPDEGDSQWKADVRWRIQGQSDDEWITRFGSHTANPGTETKWTMPSGTFAYGYKYEWQVRTYDTLGGGLTPSDWSDSEFFRAIRTPGRDASADVVPSDEYQGALGCGSNRAYALVKGGKTLLGELTPCSMVKWTRLRDDISKCNVTLNINTDPKACELAAILRCWQHEIRVYRDDDSVWEGPITRIAYFRDRVEIEAWDVMAWVYRRIMKQGYNDTYPNLNTVVDRSAKLIINALSRDDPNVLRYLTRYDFDDDAKEARVKPDWSATAFEEVDEMAAKGGLDYTVVGRRIILWDTHRPIGRLPLMDDTCFSDPPIVTEYGMSYATQYGVTNNSGVWGEAHRDDDLTGPIEMLSSAYGQHAAADTKALTREKRDKLIETYTKQAQRNIADRYPLPLVARVPDNATLKPETPVSIRHLVPGVWIPLMVDHVCRPFSQWQKLDSIAVIQDSSGEQVQVVMSPAPDEGADPDRDQAIEDADA